MEIRVWAICGAKKCHYAPLVEKGSRQPHSTLLLYNSASQTKAKNTQPTMNSALPFFLNSPTFPVDAMEFTLPSIARDSDKGLGEVPREVLEKCLQPVMKGLQSMDANSLLDLKQTQHGAQLLPGVNVEGIHSKIEPRHEDGTVRYIHITEVPGQFTMGIFVFPPHGRIPLHDHPEMCVLSRVLYGELDRLSLDLVREEDVEAKSSSSPSSLLKSAWSSCRFGAASLPPKGSKRAMRNKVDRLVAPECTALYPYEGNLHEFVAGPNGAAVLDVLLPPYDGNDGRDCTFYHIREDDNMPLVQGRKTCWIVPTGQPEDFHCISGWYGGLGLTDESEHDDDHEDDHDMM